MTPAQKFPPQSGGDEDSPAQKSDDNPTENLGEEELSDEDEGKLEVDDVPSSEADASQLSTIESKADASKPAEANESSTQQRKPVVDVPKAVLTQLGKSEPKKRPAMAEKDEAKKMKLEDEKKAGAKAPPASIDTGCYLDSILR